MRQGLQHARIACHLQRIEEQNKEALRHRVHHQSWQLKRLAHDNGTLQELLGVFGQEVVAFRSKNLQLQQVMVWCPAAEVFKVLFGCTKQKAKSSLQCSTGQRTPGQTASSFAAPAKEGRAASSEQRRNGLHRTAARHALVDFLFDSQAYKLLVQSLFVQVYHLRQIQEVPL